MFKDISLFLKGFSVTLFFIGCIALGGFFGWAFVALAFSGNPVWLVAAFPFIAIGVCGIGGMVTLLVNPQELISELSE